MPFVFVGWGPGDAVDLIASNVLTGTATSLNFASLPSSYNHLLVVAQLRFDAAASNYGFLRFNNDSGVNYDDEGGRFLDAGAVEAAVTAAAATSARYGLVPGTNTPAGYTTALHLLIYNYSRTTFYRSFNADYHWIGDAAPNRVRGFFAGTWKDTTTVINRVEIFPPSSNFIAGSGAWVYGIQ